jgi:hypothetical protein
MSTFVPLLTEDLRARLTERARDVVEYRKSGLSLNHIQGCPLGCAYCIRHTYGLWDQDQPRALMRDADAVEALVTHRYFQPHITPIQLFNRATDPFLPIVRPHTFAVLEDLDGRGLTNHVLVITRHQMKPEDMLRLNLFRHLKVTLLFTYSGLDNEDIEPYPSRVAADSLKLMSAPDERRYRTVLYWRPLVPGLNETGSPSWGSSRHVLTAGGSVGMGRAGARGRARACRRQTQRARWKPGPSDSARRSTRGPVLVAVGWVHGDSRRRRGTRQRDGRRRRSGGHSVNDVPRAVAVVVPGAVVPCASAFDRVWLDDLDGPYRWLLPHRARMVQTPGELGSRVWTVASDGRDEEAT